MLLRARWRRKRPLPIINRSRGRMATIPPMIARPMAARTVRISMMLKVAESSRIDTAITLKDSNAPVIQTTTRASCRGAVMCTSLRVGLVLRARGHEGGELPAGGIDPNNIGKSIKRDVQPAGIGDLRHETDVGESDVGPKGVRMPLQHPFDRRKTFHDPM